VSLSFSSWLELSIALSRIQKIEKTLILYQPASKVQISRQEDNL
jgi:hypothetical protein